MKSRPLSVLVICGLICVYGLNLLGQEKLPSKKAPAVFQVKFEATMGDFVVEVHREWAPVGADRFYNLVNSGFYDGCKFFRVLPGFMAQFGINGDPEVNKKWRAATIKDDAVQKGNKRGFVTFAKTPLPNTRSTQLFINFANNTSQLDLSGFAPFGQVVEGMDAVDKIYSEYKEAPQEVAEMGTKALEAKYPKLDGIIKATVINKK